MCSYDNDGFTLMGKYFKLIYPDACLNFSILSFVFVKMGPKGKW